MNGLQKVLVSKIHRIRTQEYRHRNKLHMKPTGRNVWDKIEVKEIMEVMELIVEGDERRGMREKHSVNTHTKHGTINSVGIR